MVYELGVQQLEQIWKSRIDFLKSMEDGNQEKLHLQKCLSEINSYEKSRSSEAPTLKYTLRRLNYK